MISESLRRPFEACCADSEHAVWHSLSITFGYFSITILVSCSVAAHSHPAATIVIYTVLSVSVDLKLPSVATESDQHELESHESSRARPLHEIGLRPLADICGMQAEWLRAQGAHGHGFQLNISHSGRRTGTVQVLGELGVSWAQTVILDSLDCLIGLLSQDIVAWARYYRLKFTTSPLTVPQKAVPGKY